MKKAVGSTLYRPATLRPTILALRFGDRQIVDAGVTALHEPVRIELPILVAVRAIPVVGIVAPFVSEAHGDAVVAERPQLFDESILQLAAPLARQELDDLLAPLRKLGTVSPLAVDGVRERDARRIATVPRVLRQANFLNRGLASEGRQGGTCVAHEIGLRCHEKNLLTRTRTQASIQIPHRAIHNDTE